MKHFEKPASFHMSHRNRMKDNFEINGIAGLPPHEVLELLLGYTMARGDTNETAHRLLAEFGTLSDVLSASEDELTAVEGVGEETALFLTLIKSLVSYYMRKKEEEGIFATDSSEGADIMSDYFASSKTEFLCMFIDPKGRVLKFSDKYKSKEELTPEAISEILSEGLNVHARGIFTAEKREKGLIRELKEDLAFAESMSKKSRSVGILYCDHIIFGKDERYFMSSSPHLEKDTFSFRENIM